MSPMTYVLVLSSKFCPLLIKFPIPVDTYCALMANLQSQAHPLAKGCTFCSFLVDYRRHLGRQGLEAASQPAAFCPFFAERWMSKMAKHTRPYFAARANMAVTGSRERRETPQMTPRGWLGIVALLLLAFLVTAC